MKNLVYLIALPLAILMIFTGCSERKPLSAQEKWQKFCIVYESAAYNIMSDRQHDVTLEKSIEHLHKLPAGIEREMLITLANTAHQTPKYDQQADKEQAMTAFKTGKYQQCIAKQPAEI